MRQRAGRGQSNSGLLAALTQWGMVHVQPHSPADPAWVRPASPELALQGVLVGRQHQLARDQELLLDGHRRLASAQAKFGAGMNGRFPEHLFSVVADRTEIAELSASLVNTAHQDWMSLEKLHTGRPKGGCGAVPSMMPLRWRIRGSSSRVARRGSRRDCFPPC
jgi:hypothetical protein